MTNLTPNYLCRVINDLPKQNIYKYVNPNNHGNIKIIDVHLPEGPILIKRWDPTKQKTEKAASIEKIGTDMLWRLSNGIEEEKPVNVDRLFAGSYNLRSVLEALLVYTPEFYYSYLKRSIKKDRVVEVKNGHKHIVWMPNSPHEFCMPTELKLETVISELPSREIAYESIQFDVEKIKSAPEIARRHAQIQVALYEIGRYLEYNTYIASNDSGFTYQGMPLISHPKIVSSLDEVPMIKAFSGAANAGRLIDCIWLTDNRMPGVFEVEHSTGVTSGLTRMKNFRDRIPSILTRYVIVAADDARKEVLRKANHEIYKDLSLWYFSYSSVEELYYFCKNRKVIGINDFFIESFMEKIEI